MADNTCSLTDLACQWTWIVDEVKGLFVWFSEQFFNGALEVLNAIPLPDFVSNVGSVSVPPEMQWAVGVFELHYGAGVVAAAYGARFLVRRLPFVG